MRFAKLHGSAVALLSALLLASCGQSAPPPPPPPEVHDDHDRGRSRFPTSSSCPGRVQAFRTAEVRARVDGIVQRRLYEEGTDVGAGRALFQIDPRQMRASANAASAQLARAQASAANAGQVVAALQRAGRRAGDQRARNMTPPSPRQRTAQADVANARAQVDAARLTLGYSTVTAPISGRVGRAAGDRRRARQRGAGHPADDDRADRPRLHQFRAKLVGPARAAPVDRVGQAQPAVAQQGAGAADPRGWQRLSVQRPDRLPRPVDRRGDRHRGAARRIRQSRARCCCPASSSARGSWPAPAPTASPCRSARSS